MWDQYITLHMLIDSTTPSIIIVEVEVKGQISCRYSNMMADFHSVITLWSNICKVAVLYYNALVVI